MKILKRIIPVILLSTIYLSALNSNKIEDVSIKAPENSVYVCNSSGAKKYHSSSGCRGLNRCKASISSVSVKKAMGQGKSSCAICY